VRTPPQVTVVMRTKNVEDVLAQALDALFAQSFADFELLVVDSGSTDSTLEILSHYPATVHRIEAHEYVPGPVLNGAIERTQSPLIVFQNSDVVPLDDGALGALVEAFDDPKIQAAFGRQIPRPEADCWVSSDYARAFPADGAAPDWIPFSLPFAAMRRSAWVERPFYSEAWGSEDTEWGVYARTAGKQIRYVSDARVMHSHNYTLRQLYGRRFIEGEADAFIYGGPFRFFTSLRSWAGSIATDARDHLKSGDLRGLAFSPVCRAVYHWAYAQGHRLGCGRILAGNPDVGIGQNTVLDRYEAGS
jgi:rhamnosyltransferase